MVHSNLRHADFSPEDDGRAAPFLLPYVYRVLTEAGFKMAFIPGSQALYLYVDDEELRERGRATIEAVPDSTEIRIVLGNELYHRISPLIRRGEHGPWFRPDGDFPPVWAINMAKADSFPTLIQVVKRFQELVLALPRR